MSALALSPFVARDPSFLDVLGDGARLLLVADVDAHEGPVYAADEDALYVTTLPWQGPSGPQVAIKRIALDGGFPVEPARITVLRTRANAANGMCLDHDGALVVCEQGVGGERARISRVDRRTGRAETLVDTAGGLPLNSPNDVVVRSDGSVWFTDPSYGHLQGFRPVPFRADAVYRYDRARRRLELVADSFDKPNGLAFSPDERTLYVGDSGAIHGPGDYDPGRARHVRALSVADGVRVTRDRVVASVPGFPDGVKVDADGRLYVSAATGVRIFSPDGAPLGEIVLPGAVNFTFGGPDRNLLFITTDTAVWAAVLQARGA